MSRYIDTKLIPALFDEEFKKTRKLIIEGETHLDNLAEGFLEADRVIQGMPTADVVEVRHGYWTFKNTTYCHYGCFCSVCGKKSGIGGIRENQLKPYCPNCGAKMDGERR